MPDPKDKQAQGKEQPASQGEGSGDSLSELDQLRQELGTFRDKYEKTQEELESFRTRYDEREDQFLRDYGRQGQELGEKIKNLQELVGRVLQPADEQTGKKKRPVVVQIPDNVTEQEKFIEFQQGLVEQVRELQDELHEVKSAGGQSQSLQAELKALKDDINLVRYENYIVKEEADLREKYGLSDRDLERVRKHAKESGLYSLEAAATKTPGLDKAKMYSNYLKYSGQSNGHEEEESEELPKKKSRYNARQVGEEMLKTKPDTTIPKGGATRTEGETGWLDEMNAAVLDNSFFSWPKAKQEEYENRLKQFHNSQEPPKKGYY